MVVFYFDGYGVYYVGYLEFVCLFEGEVLVVFCCWFVFVFVY